jgi:hypothetical protein
LKFRDIDVQGGSSDKGYSGGYMYRKALLALSVLLSVLMFGFFLQVAAWTMSIQPVARLNVAWTVIAALTDACLILTAVCYWRRSDQAKWLMPLSYASVGAIFLLLWLQDIRIPT